MADVSVSDVTAEFCGVKFTLRASLECMVQLENATGESYAIVMNRVLNTPVPRLKDVSEAFAAFALPHGKHNGASVRALMSFAEQAKQFRDMQQYVAKAVSAALPPKGDESSEGGSNAPADPQ